MNLLDRHLLGWTISDVAYLKSRNLGFASSPGSNANSVAEYVITALLIIAHQQHEELSGKTIGIIGVGNIGKLVKEKSEALGMHPVLNDPPLAELGQIDHRSLQEVLSCDIVTLHVPLTQDGPFPTQHLINEQTLAWLKPSTILINASRGEVVDTLALLDAIKCKRIGPTILDVWEHEPHINWDLFEAVTIGTPHIAGHSLDGKAMGTFMIYNALCKHLGIEPTWNPCQSLPPPTVPSIAVTPSSLSNEENLHSIFTKIYDLEADHGSMKKLLTESLDERAGLFDALRKDYPVRREFHQTEVNVPEEMTHLSKVLRELGLSNG